MNTTLLTKLALAALVCLCLGSPSMVLGQKVGKAGPGSLLERKPSPPVVGEIEKVWVEHNFRGGMRIHVEFKLEDAENARCQAVAYFFDDSGRKLRTHSKKYRAVDGQMAAGQFLWVTTGGSKATEVTILMPYDELLLPKGSHDLRLRVQLLAKGVAIDWSDAIRFRVQR